jgi:hypothetical protein
LVLGAKGIAGCGGLGVLLEIGVHIWQYWWWHGVLELLGDGRVVVVAHYEDVVVEGERKTYVARSEKFP